MRRAAGLIAIAASLALLWLGAGSTISSARKSFPFDESAVERNVSRSPVCGLWISVPILTNRVSICGQTT